MRPAKTPLVRLLLAVIPLAAQSADAQNRIDYGVGINTATGELRGKCLIQAQGAAPSVAGRSFSYFLDYIDSREKLRESLGISVQASLRSLGGSADGRVDFARSAEIDRYSLSMLIRGEIRSDYLALQDPQIKSDLRHRTAAAFLAQCGDGYIDSLQWGGSIYGLMAIDTVSQTEKESLRAALQARFAGISTDADVQREFERQLAGKQFSISYYQEGGQTQGMPSSFSNIREFWTYAKQIEASILSNPAVVSYTTKSYQTVDGTLSNSANIAQRRFLREAIAVLDQAREYRDALRFVESHPWRFATAGVDLAARTTGTAVDPIVRTLEEDIKDCVDSPDQCTSERSDATKARLAELQSQNPPPVANPLYEVFDLSSYESTPRYHYFDREGCKHRFNIELIPGELRITPEGALSYGFLCERSSYFYNCGGGWDDQFSRETRQASGTLTAQVSTASGRVSISGLDVNITGGRPDDGPIKKDWDCQRDLIVFMNGKQGTVVSQAK